MKPSVVVLSSVTGVGGWGWFISSSMVHMGSASLQFMKAAPVSESAVDDATCLMIVVGLWMAPLGLGGRLLRSVPNHYDDRSAHRTYGFLNKYDGSALRWCIPNQVR